MTGFPLVDGGGGRPLSEEVLRFLVTGAAPVVVSAGSANAVSHDFYGAAIAACGALGLRAIAVTADRHQLPTELPANVLYADYAPFAALLPRCAAFIHHGGIGTVSQALRAGIPQLIQPMAFDQFDNASRVVRLNAGRELLPRRFIPQRVARELQFLLGDPGVAAACQRVAGMLVNENGVAHACDVLMASVLPAVVPDRGRLASGNAGQA